MNLRYLGATLACAIALAACGGGGSSAKSTDTTDTNPLAALAGNATTTNPYGATQNGRTPQGPAIGKIRVANLVWQNGQPGPAMDLYDTDKPASTDQALIKGLQYGQISDYVTPHGWVQGDTTSNLYAFPAGSLTKTQSLTGSNIDNSGFQAGEELTLGLFAPTAGTGLGETQIGDAGPRATEYESGGAVPAGESRLVVHDTASQSENAPEHYLVIDDKCPTARDQASDIPTTLGDSWFNLTPGSHVLGVAKSPSGSGLTTCAGVTQTGKTTVTFAAGQRVDAFVFGDPNAPSVVAAAVS